MSYTSMVGQKSETAELINRFNADTVRQLIISISQASGVPSSDAEIFADALIDADIQGTTTHGVSRLNIYIRRIQRGLIDPAAELQIVKKNGSMLTINANNGIGQVQALKALELLMP
jgi:LDH2 family malate/lactate/ureidoglycolate dehydrogenase